jgi:Flp pilus assembly protein TadD
MTAKKADDAIAYLQGNLEYFPESARLSGDGAGEKRKGRQAGAIKDLEKALEVDPKNARARNQLQQLK